MKKDSLGGMEFYSEIERPMREQSIIAAYEGTELRMRNRSNDFQRRQAERVTKAEGDFRPAPDISMNHKTPRA